MTSARESSAPTCEHCGATREEVHAFARGGSGSGTATFGTVWQSPGRADVVLGRPGYLCNRCWWAAPRMKEAA